MTDQLKKAHKSSSHHVQLIRMSQTCGCFHCTSVFPSSQIREWTDRGATALCPECGIDSVLPAAAGYPLEPEFLKQMERHWFGQGTTYKVVNGQLVEDGRWADSAD